MYGLSGFLSHNMQKDVQICENVCICMSVCCVDVVPTCRMYRGSGPGPPEIWHQAH